MPLCAFNLLYIRPGYQGGTARYAIELLHHLSDLAAHEIVVYAQEGLFGGGEIPFRNARLVETPAFPSLVLRVAYEQICLPFLLKRDRVDLLLSPGFVTPLWGNCKKVITVHDLYYMKYPHYVRPWQRRYLRVFVPLGLRVCDAVVAVSETTRRDLADAYPWATARMHRIYPGIDRKKFSCSGMDRHDEARYFLMVGNLTPNKNVELVIDAMRLLAVSHGGCKLKIVGSDPSSRIDAGQLRAEGIDVELLTGIPDEQLRLLYCNATCLIQASKYEGFGLPVLEAMAAGLPVVASTADSLSEIAGDAALYFPPDSPSQLASQLDRLMQDGSLRKELVDKGFENLERFSWSDSASQTAGLFSRILGGCGA
ncbi:glycosyltransferase family 1 protein [Thiohalobacter sp. IOR34]|uniref:glycosyltransferase family 4 protein n=1 Tax=Thiohalobacter sp. IOR34 TaxID=3057176 RepID=UPI0025B0D4C7|nr:glycosyltransferase family 1 protein [Thiohalobacter sp. IOR34]WJW76714.1 glycosyltransferase family 1 protein [Thiohalobacter sp. IOR34]